VPGWYKRGILLNPITISFKLPIKRLDSLPNPENYEIIETTDGFVGRLIRGANPNVYTGQEAFDPFIDPTGNEITPPPTPPSTPDQSTDESSTFTDEQPVGETGTGEQTPEETTIATEKLKRYRDDLKAAYVVGNLNMSQYMVALDLLAKRDFQAIQSIMDLLDTSNDPNIYQRTEAFEASGKANLRILIDYVGSQMYKGNTADVVIKETVQNSFDAVKASLNTRGAKGIKNGQIDVISDLHNRIIAIRDNGQGMTKDTIENAFLTIAGSDKPGQKKGDAAGRYGMAKVVFLNDSEWVELNTGCHLEKCRKKGCHGRRS